MFLLLSIGAIAGSALAYQLLLMRLLSVVHWYPFAAMIVSLALLGHGVSGTALSFCGSWARTRFHAVYAFSAAAFGVAAVACFALAQRVPFNGLELVWDLRQLPRLAAIYLLLSLPFFFAASCFGLAFVALRERIARLYAADLIGAGLGAVAVIGLLYALPLHAVLLVAAAGGFFAAALALVDARRPLRALAVVAVGLVVLLATPPHWIAPRVNPYKGLSRALLVPGTAVVAQHSSPLGTLTVIASPEVPLRHAPGLSLNATQEPAAQLGMFTDGDALTVITAAGGDAHALAYLGQSTSALPYALLDAPRVLVLGAGGGTDVLQALQLGAREVHAVELNPQLVRMLRGPFAGFAGHLYDDARVRVVIGDARNALRAAPDSYDLVALPLVDSAVGAGAGAYAAADDFLYTVESLHEARARLRPSGFIAVTRWETLPPRASLKLLATAVAALRAEGVADPAQHLVLIRGWQTSTLLVKRAPLTDRDIARVEAFCARLSFDPVHYPGLRPEDANRYNLVAEPYLFEGARALLGTSHDAYLAAYKFDLAPATDDRPFFHNFFKWGTLPELWRLRGSGGAALLESGYLVLVATLLQALPLALTLILLPLLALRKVEPRARRWAPAVYFFFLGIAFLFVEIAALSRFALFIGHPLWAATTVLAALLGFAGLGSAVSPRVRSWSRPTVTLVAILVAILLCYEFVLPTVFSAAAAWPVPAKAFVSALLLAPLAFCMGMPFPLGLARLAATAPGLIPWAWGINGCASVLSALLAVLLAIAFGYPVVVYAAAALYVLAAVVWREPAPLL